MIPQYVAVGSMNPLKIEASRTLAKYQNFRFEAVNSESGVRDQPFGYRETKQGAQNRANDAFTKVPFAMYAVGLEGGINLKPNTLTVFAYCAITNGKQTHTARSVEHPLPLKCKDQILIHGKEVGDITDELFAQKNSKQKTGITGMLTRGILNRKEMLEQVVLAAYIPFFNPELKF
jgi:inosine/xanthosine triphosphatase